MVKRTALLATLSLVMAADNLAKSNTTATPAVPSATEEVAVQIDQEYEKALRCLALNVYHEARAESKTAQLAVAAVTLNRVESGMFPDNVCGVVKQRNGKKGRGRCQFSWVCDRKSDQPRAGEAWESALEIARLSLDGLAQDPTHGALYFHANHVSPDWSKRLRKTAKIGNHHFYKPRDPKGVQLAARD